MCTETYIHKNASPQNLYRVFIAYAASHPRARGESSTTRDKRTTWLFDITRIVAGSSCKIPSRSVTWVSGKIEIIPRDECRRSCERSSLISRNFLEYERTGRFIILPGDVCPLICTVGVLPRIFGAISARQNAHGEPCRGAPASARRMRHVRACARARTRARAHRYIRESANLRANKLSRAPRLSDATSRSRNANEALTQPHVGIAARR